MRKALCIRHTLRDLTTDELTPDGIAVAKQVIAPFAPFDRLFSTAVKHCWSTAQTACGGEEEIICTYQFIETVCFSDDLKQRAAAEGVDHSLIWFRETPREEALSLIAYPSGECYFKDIVRAAKNEQFKRALFVLRGTGLEGLARILDPSYSPFNGSHFEPCEGFWVAFDDGRPRLLSYVRRR